MPEAIFEKCNNLEKKEKSLFKLKIMKNHYLKKGIEGGNKINDKILLNLYKSV